MSTLHECPIDYKKIDRLSYRIRHEDFYGTINFIQPMSKEDKHYLIFSYVEIEKNPETFAFTSAQSKLRIGYQRTINRFEEFLRIINREIDKVIDDPENCRT